MSSNITLKKNPKIEFHLLDDGFKVIDTRTETNSGYYLYSDLVSVELNKAWFPKLAKYLRALTWIFNGVPLFPDADSYKKANLIFHFNKTKLGIWLTDTHMAHNAKLLAQLLDQKISTFHKNNPLNENLNKHNEHN